MFHSVDKLQVISFLKQQIKKMEEHTCSDERCEINRSNGVKFGCSNLYVYGGVCRGPYAVTEEIGRGAYGKIYKISNQTDAFAFKHVYGTDDTTEFKLQDMAARIGCAPRIIQAVYSDNEGIGIIMELAQQTLKDAIIDTEDEPIEIQKPIILAYIRSVYEQLLKLHSIGIVHNDLHIENIMNLNGKWVFIDFGLATMGGEKRDDFTNLLLSFMELIAELHGHDIFSDMRLTDIFPDLVNKVTREEYLTMEKTRKNMF